MRLIDADALNIDEEVMRACEYAGITELSGESGILTGWIIGAINLAKTIDAVPVVRCRDCKYWANGLREERPCNKTGAYPMRSEDYCSYGERTIRRNTMKCEKCGKETDSILIGIFNHDGSDSDIKVPALNADEKAAIIDVTQNWTGYELDEDEQRDTIKCPHCNQFPFKNGEIQVYDIVRIVCFKQEEHNETD